MPTPMGNYVKFQRGTIAAYNSRKTAGRIDEDTLYFVYESNESEVGQLYLGERLISGNINLDLPESLTSLAEVLESADAVSFLVADSDGNWKVKTPEEVKLLLNTSAGGESLLPDENQFKVVNGTLKLLGFDEATNGQVLQKVDGNVDWVDLPDISSLQSVVNNLDSIIAGAIADAGNLKYQKVDSLESIEDSAEENIIYLVPNEDEQDDNQYDEYMLVDGALEKIGVFGGEVNLDNYVTNSKLEEALASLATVSQLQAIDNKFDDYVTTTVFNSTVGNLSDFNSYEEGVTQSIVDELNVLDQRLTWQIITAD